MSYSEFNPFPDSRGSRLQLNCYAAVKRIAAALNGIALLKNQETRDTVARHPKKILILTDHNDLCTSLKDFVHFCTDLVVADEAISVSEARRLLERDSLDLVLIDQSVLPSLGAKPKPIFPKNPSVPLILMTLDQELAQIKNRLVQGFRGFVTKHDVAEELIPAVQNVLNGQGYLSRELLEGIPPDIRAGVLLGDVRDQAL